jgi:hypothetical protein
MAAGLLGAILAALVLAVLPRAHHAVHCDAHEPEHVCAVTLFSHGQVDLADGFVPLPGRELFRIVVTVSDSSVFLPCGLSFLQPARGPPASA